MAPHIPVIDILRLARGRLRREESVRVKRHIYTCSECLRLLIDIEYKLAVEEAIVGTRAPVPDEQEPLFIVHDTGDGLVYSRAEQKGGKWIARHWGRELNGATECGTMREANDLLVRSFAEMYPEHRCTERCRIDPAAVEES
jgi:hypothetical protein